jgi:hemolysin D
MSHPIKRPAIAGGARQKDKHYLAFLPAAIEIEHSPPPLYGRLILWSIVALVLVALFWAWQGKIDIVAVAPGKIIPAGKAKSIQAYERSVIKEIHVLEGQRVSAGDVLVSLDATISRADEQQASRDLREAKIRWLLELGFDRFLQTPGAAFNAATVIKETLSELNLISADIDIELQTRLLLARIGHYQSRLSGLQSQLQALQAERNSAASAQNRYRRTLPIIRERVGSINRLYQQQLASRDQYLQLEQQHIEQQQGLQSETARVEALSARVAQTSATITALNEKEREQNLGALREARHQAYILAQAQQKAEQRQELHQLRAPVDGIVQQLQVHTVGGIVNPAQTLMTLIPERDLLEVEAFIRNRDIGFVHQGQDTAIKVDTFNFTRYGTIDGKLKTLSTDAVEREGQGLVYPVTVIMASNSIDVQGRPVSLSPGMAVTVEIKTGTRRVIEFFLSPLLKLGSESIRER